MEWISVKDRLPEVSQEVIVTDGICSVCAQYFKDSKKFINRYPNVDLEVTAVTHWMPLPTPPKNSVC